MSTPRRRRHTRFPRCKVCNSPHAARIDRDLLEHFCLRPRGEATWSFLGMEEEYGIPRRSISRHYKRHFDPERAAEQAEVNRRLPGNPPFPEKAPAGGPSGLPEEPSDKQGEPSGVSSEVDERTFVQARGKPGKGEVGGDWDRKGALPYTPPPLESSGDQLPPRQGPRTSEDSLFGSAGGERERAAESGEHGGRTEEQRLSAGRPGEMEGGARTTTSPGSPTAREAIQRDDGSMPPSAELILQICGEIRAGAPDVAAAAICGVDKEVFTVWVERGEQEQEGPYNDLVIGMEVAKAQVETELAALWKRIVTEPVETVKETTKEVLQRVDRSRQEVVTLHQRVVVRKGTGSWEGIAEWLRRREALRWNLPQTHKMVGAVQVKVVEATLEGMVADAHDVLATTYPELWKALAARWQARIHNTHGPAATIALPEPAKADVLDAESHEV